MHMLFVRQLPRVNIYIIPMLNCNVHTTKAPNQPTALITKSNFIIYGKSIDLEQLLLTDYARCPYYQ